MTDNLAPALRPVEVENIKKTINKFMEVLDSGKIAGLVFGWGDIAGGAITAASGWHDCVHGVLTLLVEKYIPDSDIEDKVKKFDPFSKEGKKALAKINRDQVLGHIEGLIDNYLKADDSFNKESVIHELRTIAQAISLENQPIVAH